MLISIDYILFKSIKIIYILQFNHKNLFHTYKLKATINNLKVFN